MKEIQGVKIFRTNRFGFGIDNAWNHECDMFRGIDIRLGFFYIQILRAI